MPCFTAFTTVDNKDAADRIGLAIENMVPEPTGVGVFEIEDGKGHFEIGGYFAENPDATALQILATAFDSRPFVVSEVPDQDWVAKVRRELSPVRAGRFFVYGSHDANRVPDDVVPLAIDAAMAFGTGHHGTTQGCLQALDELAGQGVVPSSVADIGCGTAVLAMAAAKIWPRANIIAGDIDQVAIDTSRANLACNNLSGRVTCVTFAGFDHTEITPRAPFDLVFANILKSPLIALAPDMNTHVSPMGYVILSGILNTQADAIISVYTREKFDLHAHFKLGEWSTLTLRKRGRDAG